MTESGSACAGIAGTPGRDASRPARRLLAVLPLRDIVVFPHMIVPLFVGREKSVRALRSVMQTQADLAGRHRSCRCSSDARNPSARWKR